MWGSSIVGFGDVHFRYASGHEADWFAVGFSPRKKNLTLYLTDGIDRHTEHLERLGPDATGKGCLYIKRLDAVDREVLDALIREAASGQDHQRRPGVVRPGRRAGRRSTLAEATQP